jgi:hypothetical protein
VRESTEVLIERPDLAVAIHDRILIAIPRGVADIAVVRDIRAGLETAGKRAGGGGIGFLFVVAATSTTPTGMAREEAAAMFDAARPYLRVLSAQLEGTGFAAAAKRSVFTWATSRMLGKTPVKTFAILGDAADWLETKCKELGIPCPPVHQLEASVRRIHTPEK